MIEMFSLIVRGKVHFMSIQIYGGQGTVFLSTVMFSLIVRGEVNFMNIQINEGQGTLFLVACNVQSHCER